MKYVSEENLRNWFEEMKKKYTNCPFREHLESVEMSMFGNSLWESDKLNFEEKEE